MTMKMTALRTEQVRNVLTLVNERLGPMVKHWWIRIPIDGSSIENGTNPTPEEKVDKFIDVKFIPQDKRVDENQVMHEDCFVAVLNHIARYRQIEVTFFITSVAPQSN